MEPESLLKLIGRFTGLYAGDDLIEANRGNKLLHAARSQRRPRHEYVQDYLARGARTLQCLGSVHQGDRATLNAFFAPYNAMLAELVGNPDFTW